MPARPDPSDPAAALDAIGPATSRKRALGALRAAFSAAGIGEGDLDARLLVEASLGLDAAALLAHPDVALGQRGAAALLAMGRRRVAREPVSRILGVREFWGLPFRLSPETLVPRPDSETVVEAALRARTGRATGSVLDLGTGSGCLLVALLTEWPGASGIGIDRSEGAARAARDNARRNGVAARTGFVVGDWAAALAGRFDVVVSNPPYIPSGIVPALAPEVSMHDPLPALDGGVDGLSAYRAILGSLDRLLADGGTAVLEMGDGQRPEVEALARGAGFGVTMAADLGGRERALVLARP